MQTKKWVEIKFDEYRKLFDRFTTIENKNNLIKQQVCEFQTNFFLKINFNKISEFLNCGNELKIISSRPGFTANNR